MLCDAQEAPLMRQGDLKVGYYYKFWKPVRGLPWKIEVRVVGRLVRKSRGKATFLVATKTWKDPDHILKAPAFCRNPNYLTDGLYMKPRYGDPDYVPKVVTVMREVTVPCGRVIEEVKEPVSQ